MLKNTIISSFKKAPKGFLVFLAFFAATEIALNLIRPQIVAIFWNKFIVNEHALIDMPGDFDYVIMGDSIQKTGIEPRLVSDKILSLGLPGAKPPSLYLLLSRYLKRHKPPKAVFLFIDPQEPNEAMHVILKYFVTIPELCFLWNDLSRDERMSFFLKYWVSFDERLVSLPLRQIYYKPNGIFIREMKDNRGFMPLPNQDTKIADDHFAVTKDRPENTISLEKRDYQYMDKFMALARSKNIKVVFMGNIMPKELYDLNEKNGFNLQWMIFLDVVRKKYPEAEVVKEPILYLENKYFADMSHVNTQGRAIYTEYFKNRVFIPHSKELPPAPSLN